MGKDDRDILDILKFELDFVENGGYRRSVLTPWKPASTFQDSLTCINFGDPHKGRPCAECLLIDFVPEERKSAQLPCHHIPLTESGVTAGFLEQRQDRAALENALKIWLRKKILEIEARRSKPTIH
jgi:hypothetical protein